MPSPEVCGIVQILHKIIFDMADECQPAPNEKTVVVNCAHLKNAVNIVERLRYQIEMEGIPCPN